ncbi:MAG: metal ABC transporter substrate-binding protein [Anaerolineae bacterium]|nr:metal ABC transporter substrate-binding protein [Anaerolineae bacterium]
MPFHQLIFLLLISSLFVSCNSSAALSPNDDINVVTTTTLLADITQNIAGARLQVESLLPLGVDPHSYQPIPQDVVKIVESDLLIVNGADYEQFLANLLANAGGQTTVIVASAGLETATEAQPAGLDPHFWIDPNNVIVYVKNIRDGLTHIDPDGAQDFKSNADAYIQKLQELDSWIIAEVTGLPVEKRLLVTNHDNLGYFAKRYGFTVIGTVVPGFSSDAAPAAGQMAELIDQIKASQAQALFLDTAEPLTMGEQIASDTGLTVVTDLQIESLTEGPPAGTYLDLMTHNVTRIIEALR